MIDDGVDGYLFEAGNVADLQSKLDTFLALHADSVKEMGEAARVKVEREYNPESHYVQLMDIYRQAISFK
jgi:glycosyltransferase involved in cell wall biosynthesis